MRECEKIAQIPHLMNNTSIHIKTLSTMTIIEKRANNSTQEYDHSMNGISIKCIPKLSSRINSTGLSSGSSDLQSN